jgi:hypothetical protein
MQGSGANVMNSNLCTEIFFAHFCETVSIHRKKTTKPHTVALKTYTKQGVKPMIFRYGGGRDDLCAQSSGQIKVHLENIFLRTQQQFRFFALVAASSSGVVFAC